MSLFDYLKPFPTVVKVIKEKKYENCAIQIRKDTWCDRISKYGYNRADYWRLNIGYRLLDRIPILVLGDYNGNPKYGIYLENFSIEDAESFWLCVNDEFSNHLLFFPEHSMSNDPFIEQACINLISKYPQYEDILTKTSKIFESITEKCNTMAEERYHILKRPHGLF